LQDSPSQGESYGEGSKITTNFRPSAAQKIPTNWTDVAHSQPRGVRDMKHSVRAICGLGSPCAVKNADRPWSLSEAVLLCWGNE